MSLLSRTIVIFALLLFSFPVLAADDDWRPVTKAELEMNTPKVEAGADAEAIFWEVRVDDSKSDLERVNYVRVKIFTERGREMFSKYDIPFLKGISIKDIEARVTKADGSVALLKKEDIFEKEIVKGEGFKVKAKSFAMPGLEVGAILEYRYREVSDRGLMAMPLIFQRDIPVQSITYYLRPSRGTAGLYAQSFNVGNTWFEDDKKDYKRVTMTNVPAFPHEPNMLPEDEVRAWMYVYYSNVPNVGKPVEYWRLINSALYEASKVWTKPDDSLKQAASEIVAGSTTDDAKLRKIYEFTQDKIRNTLASGTTPEEKKKAQESKTPADTLKLGIGMPSQVDFLFGALAAAAGFEVHAAYTGNRRDMFFNPSVSHARLMLTQALVAVKTGNEWRFFTPSSRDVSYGMVNWAAEDQTAFITAPGEPVYAKIPLSPPERTASKRTGKFKLLADGTLEGEAQIEFTGHWAGYYKGVNRGSTPDQREKALRDYVKSLILTSAEVESFKIEGLDDGNRSFVYTFKVRIPNYSAKTGKRLFFQPNIFARSSKPRFTASTRKSEIYFNYPWLEEDQFTIEFPDGFTLENADTPPGIRDQGGIGKHDIQMGVSKDGKTLTYGRQFSWGNGGNIRFSAESYPVIKQMFESFNKADVHQISLKEASPPQ